MTNLDIIRTFESEEMGKFLAATALQKWTNWRWNKEWLEQESEDGLLRNGYMVWDNGEWVFDRSKRDKIYFDNWVLAHIPDILEFLLTQEKITSSNVLVVIPTIESGHRFDDYKDIIHYKGINFTIWSDFFDYNEQEDIRSSREGEENYKKYLSTYYIVNFMKNYGELVNTIRIYYKNK